MLPSAVCHLLSLVWLGALGAAGPLAGQDRLLTLHDVSPDLARLIGGTELDFVASSESWGVHKPAPEFFAYVVAAAGVPAEEIAYVGDRLDNDVLPAREAGMVSVFLRRGPWGFVHANRPEAAAARIRIDSLAELPAALRDV